MNFNLVRLAVVSLAFALAACGGGSTSGAGGGTSGTGGGTSGPSYVAAQVASGRLHTCAITSTGAVMCWGAREAGQLGNGAALDTTKTYAPVAVPSITTGATAITATVDHTCAIVSGGVKCWGEGADGQLGNGGTTLSSTPVNVSGLTSGVTAIATGYTHSCALTTAGAMKCWGKNDFGQLGDNTQNDSKTPVAVMGLSSGVTAIAVGRYHSCAVISGGLKCWGGNIYGELGIGTNLSSALPTDVTGLASGVTSVSAGDSVTCAITTAGLKCWGRNADGQLGNMMSGIQVESTTAQSVVGMATGVSSVSVGSLYTCAVQAGAAKCWGTNYSGEVGASEGPGFKSSVPVQVTGLTAGVSAISAGAGHVCARIGGVLKCWGSNSGGELGNGNSDDQYAPVAVTGFP